MTSTGRAIRNGAPDYVPRRLVASSTPKLLRWRLFSVVPLRSIDGSISATTRSDQQQHGEVQVQYHTLTILRIQKGGSFMRKVLPADVAGKTAIGFSPQQVALCNQRRLAAHPLVS